MRCPTLPNLPKLNTLLYILLLTIGITWLINLAGEDVEDLTGTTTRFQDMVKDMNLRCQLIFTGCVVILSAIMSIISCILWTDECGCALKFAQCTLNVTSILFLI